MWSRRHNYLHANDLWLTTVIVSPCLVGKDTDLPSVMKDEYVWEWWFEVNIITRSEPVKFNARFVHLRQLMVTQGLGRYTKLVHDGLPRSTQPPSLDGGGGDVTLKRLSWELAPHATNVSWSMNEVTKRDGRELNLKGKCGDCNIPSQTQKTALLTMQKSAPWT